MCFKLTASAGRGLDEDWNENYDSKPDAIAKAEQLASEGFTNIVIWVPFNRFRLVTSVVMDDVFKAGG